MEEAEPYLAIWWNKYPDGKMIIYQRVSTPTTTVMAIMLRTIPNIKATIMYLYAVLEKMILHQFHRRDDLP